MDNTGKTSVREWPKKIFGNLPAIDQFITRADAPETLTPSDRWLVDGQGFPNLTKAREHVIGVLDIPNSQELSSDVEYPVVGRTPSAADHSPKTKGNTMAGRTLQSPEQALAKLDAARVKLRNLQDQQTEGMAPEQLAAHNKAVKNAAASVNYFKNTYENAKAGKPAHAKQSQPAGAADTPAATAKPAAPMKVEAVKTDVAHSEHISRIGEPLPLPRYEVAIPTTGGRNVMVKCNDTEALDGIFAMIKKHSL